MVPGVAESKVGRSALAIGVLVCVAFVARPEGLRPPLLDAEQRAYAFRFAAELRASEIAARCERPALRAPHTGDGSALLLPLADPTSSISRCTKALFEYSSSRKEPCGLHQACPPEPLATLVPPAGLVETCAPLHAAISELAHATEACSPYRPGRDDAFTDATSSFLAPLYVGHAVRFHIAPMVARGDVAAAARHVLDAMRFMNDYSRHGAILAAMGSRVNQLALTLDELLDDPRLTAADAKAISHDLHILRASLPTFDEMIRAEAAWLAREVSHMQPLTHDADEQRALILLATKRWLIAVHNACYRASPRECAGALPKVEVGMDSFEDDLARASSSDEAVDLYYAQWMSFIPAYTKHFIEQEASLRRLHERATVVWSLATVTAPIRNEVIGAALREAE